MTRPGLSLLRGMRRALGTLAARIYLTACVLLLGWALVVSSEGSMAIVIPLLATMPASLVLFVLPEHSGMLLLSMVLGALVNALVIGWCARVLRRGSSPDPAS
ncbi:SCO4225 family membrane protein [Streptomyces sp. NBC_00328]|uniref:SCO4225 family membrane protein n=1 Tax=Streptomyces sp. NBC_00328 TaxID=2903646 RepID=UPI002E2E2BA2|nr:hypothetical protein [Streptomyces sp. NBC_00328]